MSRARLVAALGAGGALIAAALYVSVPKHEGEVLTGYRDPIGVVTACVGHTATAELGRRYTREECQALLAEDLAVHAEGAGRCVDFSTLTPGQKAAVVSFTFNVGVRRFCESTFAQKLRDGDPTACAELSKWTLAGGRQLPGLVKRRADERRVCEEGLA